jgi:GNAT superfamily N-acetyltransferase
MACTDRLYLRLLRPEDAVHLEEVVEPGWVEAMMAQGGDRPLSPWAVVLRDGGAIVPEYRGRGLATEAAAIVLDWAERHDIDVYASIRPPNPTSVRVLEKIGMRLVDSYRDEDGAAGHLPPLIA